MTNDRPRASSTGKGTLIGIVVFVLASIISYGIGIVANYACGLIYNAVFAADTEPFMRASVAANTDLGFLLQGLLAGGPAIATTGAIQPRANTRAIAYVTSIALLCLYGIVMIELLEDGAFFSRTALRDTLFFLGWVGSLLVVSHWRRTKGLSASGCDHGQP